MRHYLVSVSLIISVIGLSACASSDLVDQLRRSDLSIDKTQTRFTESDQNFGDRKVTLVNTDFNTPRRIENLTSVTDLGEVAAPEGELKLIAIQIAKNLFPELELRLIKLNEGSRYSYATFQQIYQNKEVFESKLVLRLTKSGDWKTVSANLVNQDLLSRVSSAQIELKATSHYFSKPHYILRQREVFYPKRLANDVTQVFLAKEYTLYSIEDQLEIWLWIDQASGEILGAYNPAARAMPMKVVGTISPHAPSDPLIDAIFPSVTAILADQSRVVADMGAIIDVEKLRGTNAKVILENAYVSVVNNAKKDSALHLTDELLKQDHLNIDAGPAPEERNIYYWIMAARKFLHEKLNFDGMNYQLVATANFGERFDNAFFMPLTKTLSFGAGGLYFKNTALARDIVIHEFGHAVTFEIYGMQDGYEFRAMDEAMSDYFAAEITNDPQIGMGALLPALIQRRGTEYLRTVDNDFVYPKDFLGNSFHDDGQMFSGSLWKLRKAIGSELADKMIHEARLAQAKSIREFLLELLVIDEKTDDANPLTASRHERAIWQAFRAHGLNSKTEFIEGKKEDLTIPWKREGCLAAR